VLKYTIFVNIQKRPKNGQMAKSFYFWQTVSKKAKFGRLGFKKGQMATLQYIYSTLKHVFISLWCVFEELIIIQSVSQMLEKLNLVSFTYGDLVLDSRQFSIRLPPKMIDTG